MARQLFFAALVVACPVTHLAVPGALFSASRQATGTGTSASATGAVSGVVVDAVTRRPLAGATVTLSRWLSAEGPPRMVTDGRGRFVFANLAPADNYFLDATRLGYSPTRYGWTGPNGPLTLSGVKTISVTAGQWVSGIEILLWRLGSISGRVLDERGEPAVGVAVRAFTTSRISGHRQLVGGPIGVTDDRGSYRLPQLEPARYTVAVLSVQTTVPVTLGEGPQLRAVGELETGGIVAGTGASAVVSPAIDVDGRHRLVVTNFATPPPSAAGQARAYPAVFYPGVQSVRDATSIEIRYGEDRDGVDFQLRPVPAFRISGRVTDAVGSIPRMLLRLMPAGCEGLGFGSEAATTVLEPEGSFTFLSVPEGEYTLLAQSSVMDFFKSSSDTRIADAPGFARSSVAVGLLAGTPGVSFLNRGAGTTEQWGRSPIVVAGRDVTDATLTLRPAVTVRGRFEFAQGTTPPDPSRDLFPQALPANGDPSLGWPRGRMERDGSFRFTIAGLLGGTYLLSSNMTLVSVMWQGRDLAETGLDATTGRDFDDVVVTLTDKRTEITGRVQNDRRQGIAAVIAFPADRSRWVNFGWNARRFRTVRAGSDSSFRLTGLPAGDYYLIAVDASHADAWTDPDFLAVATPHATRLALDWDSRVVQHLTVKEVVAR